MKKMFNELTIKDQLELIKKNDKLQEMILDYSIDYARIDIDDIFRNCPCSINYSVSFGYRSYDDRISVNTDTYSSIQDACNFFEGIIEYFPWVFDDQLVSDHPIEKIKEYNDILFDLEDTDNEYQKLDDLIKTELKIYADALFVSVCEIADNCYDFEYWLNDLREAEINLFENVYIKDGIIFEDVTRTLGKV